VAKYDSQLGNLRDQLGSARSILIALPASMTVDELSSGLALMLALKSQGKSATVVTQDTVRVSHTNLFGVGDVKDKLESTGDGNFVITLEGVVDTSTNTVPSLEKLDWYPEGGNLNLVFHPMPGQKFEPSNIVPKAPSQGGTFDLVFVLGASSLNDLGNIYSQNMDKFSSVVNIDNSQSNSNFGATNIADGNASSIAEMLMDIMPTLNLPMDQDIASNLVAGIYEATQNLTQKVNPDTFQAIAKALQLGGRVPVAQPNQSAPYQSGTGPVQNFPQEFNMGPGVSIQTQPLQMQPSGQIEPIQQAQPQPAVDQSGPVPTAQGFDLREVFQIPPTADNFTNQTTQSSSSTQEAPQGEVVQSQSQEADTKPAPDWLTPKIYKGGSLG
jgi:hypothetical protein